MGSEAEWELPVVEFCSGKMKTGSEAWISASETVRRAFEDHGAFVGVYDKVESEQLWKSFYWSMEQVFELPLETKQRKTTDRPIMTFSGNRPTIPLYESVAIFNPVSKQDCEHYTNVMWPQGNHTFW